MSFLGQIVSGHAEYNEKESERGRPPVPLGVYLTSGAFLEVTFENWESEFLQMGIYIWLTTFLYQKGSSESKDPDEAAEVDEDPRQHRDAPGAPFPVRRGGLILRLYQHSLLLAFAALFVVSFGLHFVGSLREACRDNLDLGRACPTAFEYLSASRFWFESFQNWQSEFLSIAAIVILSIFLRQRGSPESKPVHAPHSQTGD